MFNSSIRGALAGTILTASLLTGGTPVMAAEQPLIRYAGLPDGAYAVVARIQAKPGKEAALREASRRLIPQVRAEPNNLVYFLHEDPAAPGQFTFYEIFASKADFDAHVAAPHVQEWFAGLPGLANGTVQVTPLIILADPGD